MSLLTGAYTKSIYDEKSWGIDSTYKGSLYKVQPGFYSLGSLSSSFDHDYFEIIINPNYQYKIILTSDTLKYGWSTFTNSSFITFDLVNISGSIQNTSVVDTSYGSYYPYYDKSITFTSGNNSGVRRQNIWDSRGHNLRKHWPHLVG